MKILFVVLAMMMCVTFASITYRNPYVTRKTKLLQPLHPNFLASSTTESRRQKTLEDDDIRCYRIMSNTACSSSYTQNYINGIAKCGNRATKDINIGVSSCGRDKSGEFCGALFFSDSLESCSGSSCSAACSMSLKQADCCLNMTDSYSQYLDWCGLPSPSPCNNSGLRIPNTTYDPTCTSTQDYEVTKFKVGCDYAQPIIDALRKNSCTDNFQNLINLCSSRNGRYCYVELNVTGGDSVGIHSLQKAGQNCPVGSNCSLQCKNSLSDVVDAIGCCFHTANFTLHDPSEFGAVFNSSLWDTCGLQIPKQCSTSFIDAIKTLMY